MRAGSQINCIREEDNSSNEYNNCIIFRVEPKDIEQVIVYLSLIRYSVLPIVIINDTKSKIKIQLSVYVDVGKQKATSGFYSHNGNLYLLQMTENELDYTLHFLLKAVAKQLNKGAHIHFEYNQISGTEELDIIIEVGE